MKSFMRRKEIHCGAAYLEIDVYPYSDQQRNASRGQRGKKQRVTAPKQKNLNDKNARRYLTQLANANFGDEDLHVTATYKQKFLPATIEEAEREARNFLRRVEYRRKKEGLPPLKYILVTEYSTGKNSEKPVRIHHHFFMNGGLDRDTVESLWSRPKPKGQKHGERIGFINADRLQPEENGVEALCRYLTKHPNGKKRWSSSQNLEKPWFRTNDNEFSRRQVEKIAKTPPDPALWEKKYPDFILTECKPEFNERTGWSMYVKMRRRC